MKDVFPDIFIDRVSKALARYLNLGEAQLHRVAKPQARHELCQHQGLARHALQ